MTVQSVLVDGRPASFRFEQPTYPGDPNGQNDPDPRAHEASQNNPVGGPDNNPLPPACSPELMSTSSAQDSLNGTQCPANKLVVTPAHRFRGGPPFVVQVAYTGRPGVHNDGDGTTEGWFRQRQPGRRGRLRHHRAGGHRGLDAAQRPSDAQAHLRLHDTVTLGKTAIANGELVSQRNNGSSRRFPRWFDDVALALPGAIAAYLVEDSIGSFDLSERLASSGIQYYEAQDSAIAPARAATNKAIMDMQEDIVDFQSMFNGPFPFTTDGVVVGVPSASFEEEMQTKITFAGGSIGLERSTTRTCTSGGATTYRRRTTTSPSSRKAWRRSASSLFAARKAQTAAGGPGTPWAMRRSKTA